MKLREKLRRLLALLVADADEPWHGATPAEVYAENHRRLDSGRDLLPR